MEVLLKAAGDAPIMVKKKWQVDGSKQVAYIIEFIRKYIKCEPQDSLVSYMTCMSSLSISWNTTPPPTHPHLLECWCNDNSLIPHHFS